MSYSIKYIPYIGKLSNYNLQFHRALQKLDLTSVTKVDLTFDPFVGRQKTESLRTFAFHLDTPRLRQTNYKCGIKLNIVCDRTEPQIHVKFNDGQKVLFKTQNLNSMEIAEEFNVLCDMQQKRAQEAEEKKRKR